MNAISSMVAPLGLILGLTVTLAVSEIVADPASPVAACPDVDADTYADCAPPGCDPSGLTCGDCDDGDAGVHPGAIEPCDHRDDDCDGIADELSSPRTVAVPIDDPHPRQGGRFGQDAAAVGDVNGDGVTDLAVGVPLGQAPRGVVLLSGATRGEICRMSAVEPAGPEWIGDQVAGIGDVNGDAVPDVAATAPASQEMGFGEVGNLRIFSGADCSLLRKCVDPLGASLDRLGGGFGGDGRLVSFVDLNGDGVREIAVGVPGRSGPEGVVGLVLLFSPVDCGVVRRLDPPDPAAGGFFGHSVAVLPDVTGDGTADLVVGEPGWNEDRGSVLVYSGADGSLVRRITTAPGGRTDDLLGWAVDALPDVTGDAVPEIVASAMGDDNFQGSLLIYSGSTGEFIRKLSDPLGSPDDQMGRALGVAGDLTGDGIPEILATVFPRREVLVFDSGTGDVVRRLAEPVGPPDGLGSCVLVPGDLTGDGEADVVACAPDASHPSDPIGLATAGRIIAFVHEPDCDGDGVTPQERDCDDQDAALHPPSEVGGLAVAADRRTFSWQAPADPGGPVLFFDLIRSSSASGFAVAQCVDPDGADLSAQDPTLPGPGTAFYYVVRAQSECGGAGSLGSRSDGQPRVGRPCP